MLEGTIIQLSSDRYQVIANETKYSCLARGKWKKEQISPTVRRYCENYGN